MKPFEYLEPKNLEEACKLLDQHRENAKVLAGGQSLIPVLRNRFVSPRYVVNIKDLSELNYIREDPDRIRMGALVTHRMVELSPLIRKRFSILVEMEQQLASVQIRNWGTVGGNLVHADPASDLAPPLIALGAKVKLKNLGGERTVPLNEFFVDYLESVLGPDEILLEIEIPNLPVNTGGTFVKKSVTSGGIAVVSVAAIVTLEGQRVRDARIVLGGVGPTPIRVVAAEKALIGDGSIDEAAEIAKGESHPTADIRGSVEFKLDVLRAVTRSAVQEAIRRAGGAA